MKESSRFLKNSYTKFFDFKYMTFNSRLELRLGNFVKIRIRKCFQSPEKELHADIGEGEGVWSEAPFARYRSVSVPASMRVVIRFLECWSLPSQTCLSTFHLRALEEPHCSSGCTRNSFRKLL